VAVDGAGSDRVVAWMYGHDEARRDTSTVLPSFACLARLAGPSHGMDYGMYEISSIIFHVPLKRPPGTPY
jgi:hypothetical protein